MRDPREKQGAFRETKKQGTSRNRAGEEGGETHISMRPGGSNLEQDQISNLMEVDHRIFILLEIPRPCPLRERPEVCEMVGAVFRDVEGVDT